MKQIELDLIAKAIRNNKELSEAQKVSVAEDIANYQIKYRDQFFNKQRLVGIARNTFDEGWPNRMDK